MRRVLLLLSLGMLSACNCGTKPIKHAPGIIAVVLPDGRTITEADTALGFDEACLKNPDVTPVSQTIQITNDGQSPLTVSLQLTGASVASFQITSPTSTSFSVAPLQNENVTIAFAPVSPGNQSATLVVTSDDSVKPTLNVRLTGTGSSRPLQATFASACEYVDGGPSEDSSCRFLEFADTNVGQVASRTVHVSNNGCPPLQITDIAIYPVQQALNHPDGGAAIFLEGTPPTTQSPITITAGQTTDVKFDFRPFANDIYTATLLFTTNGTGDNSGQPSLPDGGPLGSNQFAVQVTGNGTQPQVTLTPVQCNFNDTTAQCTPVHNQAAQKTVANFTVSNNGNASVQITAVNIANDNTNGKFSVTSAPSPLPFTMQPFTSQPLVVTLDDYAGAASATLQVVTDIAGTVSSQLVGGNSPIIKTDPYPQLSFGDETLQPSTYLPDATLNVLNVGSGNLVVNTVNIQDINSTGTCPQFTVDGTFPLPAIVPDAGSTLTFHHHPTNVGGTDTCYAYFSSNDPSQPDPGYAVQLQAVTYINCKPIAMLSPANAASFTFPDGGNTLVLDGTGSYDPGTGDPLGNSCSPGKDQSQGINAWEWELTFNSTVIPATATTHLEPQPGANAVCKNPVGQTNNCKHLIVFNSHGDLNAPDPQDGTVNMVFDPTYQHSGPNAYVVNMNVYDGSTAPDGGFESVAPGAQLNISLP
jgi:hypothetical protein